MLTWIGRIIAILSGALFLYYLYETDILNNIDFRGKIAYVAFPTIIYIVAFALTSYGWLILLRSMGCSDMTFRGSTRILFISQLGKYIPGNVGHHVGRVVLTRETSCSTDRVVVSMVVEMLLATLIAALLSVPVVFTTGGHLIRQLFGSRWTVALIGGAILILATIFLIRDRLLRILFRTLRSLKIDKLSEYTIDTGSLLLSGAMYLLNFLLMGLALHSILAGMFEASESTLLYSLGAYSSSWFIGFLTPGSPAGLGVREIALVALLSPLHGTEAATGAAAVLRLVTTLGEGTAFAIGMAMRNPEKPTNPST